MSSTTSPTSTTSSSTSTTSTSMSTTSSTAETHVIPLIWDLEITDKQKRKEEKRNRRKERKARKNPDFMTSSTSNSTSMSSSEVTRGCGSPTFLLSRGINFDRSDFDKNGFFPTGSKLILKCEDGAKPHPKVGF